MLRSTLLLLLCSANFLPGAVLFTRSSGWTSNGENVGTSWTSHLDSGATGFITYDSFSLAGAGTVNQVSWRGIYLNNGAEGTPNTANWGINFYADSTGTPGSAVSSTMLTGAQVTRTAIGSGLFSGNTVTVYEFTANINSFAAAAGTTYWFSPLSAANTFNPFFSWIQGTSGDNGTYQLQFNGGNFAGSFTRAGDRNFILSGDAAKSDVPEPSTAIFVLCGLAGVAAGRYRRR